MIPLTDTEIATYSPPSHANLVPKPIFRFRPATPRSKRAFSHALKMEGLRFHTDEIVASEICRALDALWVGDPDLLTANKSRVTALYETLRQARQDKSVVVDTVEVEAVALAIARLTDAWPALRRMEADNARFNSDAPKVALGQFLAGWERLELKFRLEDGVVPLDLLDELETVMEEMEGEAQARGVEGVALVGFAELTIKAMSLLGLDTATEKNLPTPPQSSETPDGSAAAGSESNPANGGSETTASPPKSSKRSTKRPATSSPSGSAATTAPA